MNWLRANPFLVGLIAIVVVGAGVLTWLIVGESGRLAEVDERWMQQESEFKRLAALQPFPEPANIGRLDEQRKSYEASLRALRGQFAAYEGADERLDPSGFQDRLRREVDNVKARARQAGVRLDDKFYLGFEPYQNALPRESAVPLLARELGTLQRASLALIEAGVESFAIQRAPTPEEAGPAAPAPAAPTASTPARKTAVAGADLVSRLPFNLAIAGGEGAMRRAIAKLMEQRPLLVIRALRVRNEKEKGPARLTAEQLRKAADAAGGTGEAAAASAPAVVAAPPPAAPAVVPVDTVLRSVVGAERVEALLRVELVKFSAPLEPTRP